MRLGAMISLPFMIPLTWGIIFQDTPRWAGWSTVLLGMLISYIIQNHIGPENLLELILTSILTKYSEVIPSLMSTSNC